MLQKTKVDFQLEDNVSYKSVRERERERERGRERQRRVVGEQNHKGALMHMFDRDKWRPIYWLVVNEISCNRKMYVAVAWCALVGNDCCRGGCGGGGTSSSIIAALYTLVPKGSGSSIDIRDRPPPLAPLPHSSLRSLSFPLLTLLAPDPLPPLWMHYFLLNNANRTMSRWLRSVNTGLINQANAQWLPSLP